MNVKNLIKIVVALISAFIVLLLSRELSDIIRLILITLSTFLSLVFIEKHIKL